MFGNRLGWGISVIIVIFAALIARLVFQAGQPSHPTGWVKATVHPVPMLPMVDRILPTMNDAHDAGDYYRRAIDDYQNNSAAFSQLDRATTPDPAAVAARVGLHAILDAARCNTMDLFKSDPKPVVNYDPEKDPLVALDHVAHTLFQIAQRTDAATAEPCYIAILSLGSKLYNERVVYAELATGEELAGLGCAGLRTLAHRAHDTAREHLLQQFDTARISTNATAIQPIWAVVSNLDMNTIAAYAGDWYVLAQDKTIDPLWRVEGTLKLGQLKFSADRIGDQKAALRVLRQLATDPSELPAVHAAAVAARDMTIEQYRSLRPD